MTKIDHAAVRTAHYEKHKSFLRMFLYAYVAGDR